MIMRGKMLVSHVKVHLCRVLPHFSAFCRPSHTTFCSYFLHFLLTHPTFPTVFDPTKIAGFCYGALPAQPVCCADTRESSSLLFSPVFYRENPVSKSYACRKGGGLGPAMGTPDLFLNVMAIMMLVILTPLGFRLYSRP